MKSVFFALLLAAGLSLSVSAENSVRIYVPADSLHADQELRAGHPGEIFIEITNDQLLSGLFIELVETRYPSSPTLGFWKDLNQPNITFLLPSTTLRERVANLSGQYSSWPDTIAFALSENVSAFYLPGGTHQLIKLTVFPTRLGTVAINPGTIAFVNSLGQNITPTFESNPITVIADFDCDGNGTPDFDEINYDYRLDCNGNYLLDICESPFDDCNNNGIADGCDFDCNINGIADECEPYDDCNCNGIDDLIDISSGNFTDNNFNNVPDDCDALPDYYYRVIVAPNERHGQAEMHYGYPEEVYVFAFTPPDVFLNSAVFYGEFSWSTPDKLWMIANSMNLTSKKLFGIQGINYKDYTPNAPDSLLSYNITLNELYPSPGYFPVCKIQVIPTTKGIVTVSNYLHPATYDSSLFGFESHEIQYAPVIADDIIISEYPDCNHNGVLDSIDISNGMMADCNNNFIADFCEVDSYPETDCNNNNLIDECEIADSPYLDCNINGILDICDISADSALDCNSNNILDLCEINADFALDCNNNLILDMCEIQNTPSLDCNGNNALDECDIYSGYSEDCNLNLLPDDCEYDCNLNRIPDDCESIIDCNCNNRADYLDIQTNWSNDSNSNGIPDECEGLDNDYLRIYAVTADGDLTTNLPLFEGGSIIFALTTGPGADGVSIPISPTSSDNSRLWETIATKDVEFLNKRFLNFTSFSQLTKQFSSFPDSLLFSVARNNPTPLYAANSTQPIIRLVVNPIKQDLINWTPVSFPPSSNFIYVNTIDKLEHPLGLRYDPISISCCRQIRGNIDYDMADEIDIADIVYLVNYQFGNPSGPQPYCFNEADVDGSGDLNIADLVYMVSYQFQSGLPPLDCE